MPSIRTALERIVIVPVNGYANRLQAWASASILGASIDVPVSVHWCPQDVAASPPEILFDDQLIESTFITSSDLPRAYADPLTQVPAGLHFSAESGVVTLAGRQRGEQIYMPELMQIFDTRRTVRTLIIVAGGLFSLEAGSTFTRQRQGFYRSIAWDRAIQETVARLTEQRVPYLALHSRQTDRSLDVATSRSMRKAVQRMAQQRKIQSIFVTADSQSSRDSWVSMARRYGLEPWDSGVITLDRTESNSGRDAIVDWLIMAGSEGIIYSAASTFSREAAVAGDLESSSIPLRPTSMVRLTRRLNTWAKAASTYPKRHWLNRPR